MPAGEKAPTKLTTTWESRHTAALYQAVIDLLMSSRSSFYHLPILEEVNNHGGNRISKKIIDICSKMSIDAGLDGVTAKRGAKVKAEGEDRKRKRKSASGEGGGVRGKKIKKEESGVDEISS